MWIKLSNGETANVFIKHVRPDLADVIVLGTSPEESEELNTRKTVCEIKYGGQIVTAEARCHPKDNFVRKVGTRNALCRALKKLNVPREVRKEIHNSVFATR
jgi:hypothetical protein